MALSSITNRVTYIGDATSTVFPFSYDFFSPNDLKVFLWDTVAGVIYPQLLNTNYSISGNLSSQGTYPSGGNVVMASSIPTNLQIVITRSPSFVQNFVLNQNAPINSIGLTSQLDYLTLLVQRLQDEVSRSIGLSDGMGFVNGSTFSPQLPSSICLTSSALQVLQINSGATGFQLISLNASAVAVGSSIIPVTQGGTGQSGALTPGAVWYSINTTTMGNTVAGTAGQYLQSTGAGAPIWVTASSGGGISGSTNLTNQVAGVLPVANGGTNISSLAPQFGVLYASTPTTMGIIPSVTAGLFLQSQGSSAPIWAAAPSGSSGGSFTGSISLTGQVAGILPIANGGTNISTLPFLGSVIWASSATSMGVVPNGSAGQVLQYNGSSAPSWVNQTGGATGSTNLTNQVSGILPVANGGIGVNTILPQFGLLYASSATQVGIVNSAQAGLVLTANGSSAPSFQSVGTVLTVSTQTAAYNAQTTDSVIIVASGCSSISLYGAAGNAGKQIYIKNTSAQFSTCTISCSSGAQIDGVSSVNLNTKYEQYTLVCDGTNFNILSHSYPSTWASYTPSNTWTTNVTTAGLWRRVGDSMEAQASISMSGSPGNASSAPFVGIPLGITINLTKVLVATPSINSGISVAGDGIVNSFGQATYQAKPVISLASNSSVFIGGLIEEQTFTGTVYPFLNGVTNLAPFGPGSSTVIAFSFKVPITGWTQ